MIYLILNNVRSVHNVGSIFRTADAAGVSKIIISGYTPAPVDRFGRVRKDFIKVSLGAEKTVKWEQAKNILPVLKKLKSEGVRIVALEQDPRATSLFDYARRNKRAGRRIALILGNEVRGISKSLLKRCDDIVEIPMRGSMVRQAHHPRNSKRGKESLNVSVAAGIALFTLIG